MMRPLGINIPAHWTDEQALIVFEFIDDIRDQIWDHYCLQIQSAAQHTRHINITMEEPEAGQDQPGEYDDEIPF